MKAAIPFTTFALILWLLGVSRLPAAKAPLSEAELKKESILIATGTVVDVTSKDQKSDIEKGLGFHTDRVFTIKLKVATLEKTDGTVKAGDEITVQAWQPLRRIPPSAGLQGHGSIPAKGDTITIYVKSKDGAIHRPLLPNGILIHASKAGIHARIQRP